MALTLEETKERLKYKGEVFLNALSDKKQDEALNSLVNLMIDVQVDLREFKEDKVSRSEIKDLIIEMREGFKRVDQRFEAVDKRFEDIQKYMDRRFEAVDKRFEDMYKYMNKRFEAVDKRFESVDKRFEDMQKYMDKRFNSMQWMIGLGFTMIAIITTVYKFVQ